MNNLLARKKLTPITTQSLRQNPFLTLQTEIDKAMRDFYNLLETPGLPVRNFEDLTISPSIDIVEDDNNFKVEAEMPGLGEEDINVTISDGMLTIKGEKTTSKQDKGKNYISREIDYGSYERSIALPDTMDIDKAKASFKKGMLWVTIPKKSGAAQSKRTLKVEKVSDNVKTTTLDVKKSKEEQKR